MKHFTRHPSKVTAATDILSFKCPGCKNKTLYSAEQDVHKVADVDENELFICDECGGEFRAHPQFNGSIRFTESIESATSVDDKKIDRRLSSTSKRYKGYRISLDNRHECYNIYDPHGELEDHGFKSVDDAMAHIDELVSIESATDVDEIPDFNDWLYDKLGYGDSDLSDDDWEYYHDKYLKETGQEKYMSGNVYSSKQPGVRRKSTHHPVTAAKKRITGSYAMEDEMKRFLEWNESQADNNIANKQAVEVDYPVMVKYFEANPDAYVDLFHGFLFPKDARYADIFSKMKSLGYKPRSTGYQSRGVFDPAMTIDVPDKNIPEDLEEALDKYPELDIRRVTYHKGTAGNIKLKFILKDTAFSAARDNVRYRGTTASEKSTDDSIREASRDVNAATYPQGTYWMAKYKDMNGNLHKIVFQFDSQDFDDAEEEMDAVIPEPYTAGKLLGRCNPELAEKDGFVVLSNQDIDCAEEIEDYEDDIQEISQEFTSENTSINSSKLPAIFKMVTFQPGTINIDYGGGRFDNVADYLTQFDVINLVYDPYNRTPEHNKEVIRTVRKAGGADTATCSNVLNVIKEPEVRLNVLQNIKKLVKPNGTVYITVYEGSGKGNEGPTKSGYQLNRKTEGYLDEIKQVFPDAVRKGKLIVAHPNGSAVTSSSYKYVGEPSSFDPATGRSYYESPVDWDDKLEQIREMVASDDRLRLKGASPWGCNIVNINTKQTFAFDFWEDNEPFADQLSKFQKWLGDASNVTSAEDLSYDALTCEDCTYDLWTLVQDDNGKWVREDRIGTYDDYDEAETVAEALAKDTPCQVIEVGPNGLALVWTSKVSDPAIIEWLHDEYTMGNTKYSQLVSDLVDNFSLSTDEADQIISDWVDEDEDVHLEYDEDIDGNTDVVEGASGRKHSIKTLHDALLNRASQVMRMQGFPLNEIADYLVVDIQPAEDGWLNCEVRAELSYEGMSDMMDALNPIVQKYDKDAYFDHVTGGIISAYLPSGKFNAIQSATDTNSSKVFELVRYTPDSGENGPAGDEFDVVDWGEFESEEAAKAHWSAEIQDETYFVREGNPSDYIEEATVLGAWGVDDYPEPPESDEPEERNSREEIIIDLDDDIIVEDDGDSVEFLRDPAFLEDEDEWTPEDEPMFQIDDGDSVYEHVMDLIIDSIPAVDGKYHIKGRIKLVYDVTLSYYYEGTSEEDQTTELNKDGCSSDYDNYRSEVIELDVTEI